MCRLFAVLTFISSMLIPFAASDTSPVPNCFVCPSQDLAGRPLIEHSNSASELFCRYQSIPNDYFCKYFLSTGLLKQDHDNGECPDSASTNCQRKRHRGVPRSPYPPSAGARSPKPEVMKVRHALGSSKKKRTNRAQRTNQSLSLYKFI